MALTELQLAHRRIAQLERQFKLIEWRRPEVMFDDGIHVVWRGRVVLSVNELCAGYTVFRDGSRHPGTYCLTAGANQLEKGWREIRKAIRRRDVLTFAGGDLKREQRRMISNPAYDPFLVGQPVRQDVVVQPLRRLHLQPIAGEWAAPRRSLRQSAVV